MAIRIEGYPQGWFVFAMDDALGDGPIAARYFGRDWLVMRREGHAPAVFAPCCPHAVRAEEHDPVRGLFCPYHRWWLGFDGDATLVPESRRVHARMPTAALPSMAFDGFVFAGFGVAPDDAPPIAPLPELEDPAWDEVWLHDALILNTHPREVVENVVDVGHFEPVHHNAPLDFTNEFDGPRAIQRSRGTGKGIHASTHYSLEATYYGPGFQITRMDSVLPTLLFNAHTMIDERTLHLRFGMRVQSQADTPYGPAYVQNYIETIMHGFKQDARIWEHKRYVERPVLCDGDGPIHALRTWYAQFYPEASVVR